ncbi:hypothetical protein [Tengunoibacter tsumagoiensis]|uniref:Vacuolar-type H+-ATPase subunit H n=1 Tax=Tengunoibacter tsumagoiensis TaxID=2014871 RepID=A0A402A4F7_9CHLR|nr:hypothetical protein [Tengunoibacter tsumagoiensis]GCE14000.1 hypothetical protein KTT_38590 [Tengunoibacter tsumagoiensis]
MDILYLVDRLENLVASSRKMPLLNQIIIKEPDILNIIDMMRTSIPDEIKRARRIIQEKENILAQAQSDATAIVARARDEAERTMSREGLLRAAEERSQEMVRRANEQAQSIIRRAEERTDQLQNEADAYATETLHGLREHLLSINGELGRTIMSIERGLDSLEDQNTQQPDGEENDLIPPQQTGPQQRRASLAADSMGSSNYSD